jgi:hypothetical protein
MDRKRGENTMTRDEFIAWATANGWKPDRWSHLQKTEIRHEPDPNTGAKVQYPVRYRYKLSRIAVRLERRLGLLGWVRIRSGYFSKLSLTPDGKLSGLVR